MDGKKHVGAPRADATRNATPNKGIRGRMSFIQQRLRRNGYESEAVTNIGAVAIVNARATNISSITRGNTRNTWWIHEPNIDSNKNMAGAYDRDNKIKTCRDNLPEQAYDTLRPIFDSNLVVVVIAAGKTPGRTKELKSERIIAKGGAPEHGTDAHDESAMDFTEELPPHTAAIHDHPSPSANSAEGAPAPRANAQANRGGYHTNNLTPKPKPRRQEKNGTSTSVTSVGRSLAIIGKSPTRVVMEGHSYWRSNQHSKGVQEWVLHNADKHNHKVCIVLQHQGRRLYTSFPDAHAFWEYYSKFIGKRCFYWINRSQELRREISLLHFDIEWYSATPGDDPTTTERLHILKTAVNSSLPKPCTFTEERLSRPSPNGGPEWYNSWHLYADGITFEKNAQGCMRTFVIDKVWNKIKTHALMKCPIKGKPILDLGVYTKNRCWRVPGSTKWAECTR